MLPYDIWIVFNQCLSPGVAVIFIKPFLIQDEKKVRNCRNNKITSASGLHLPLLMPNSALSSSDKALPTFFWLLFRGDKLFCNVYIRNVFLFPPDTTRINWRKLYSTQCWLFIHWIRYSQQTRQNFVLMKREIDTSQCNLMLQIKKNDK